MPFSLVLVGDILTGRGVAPLLNGPQTSLRRFAPVIAGADLALGNLEAAPTGARTGRKPSYNPGDLAALRAIGFGGLNLANNHSLDAGESGARGTMAALRASGMQGAGLSLDGSDPVPIWNIAGRRVAVVSATAWGPFVAGNARLTRLDAAALRDKIRALTASGVFVVASLHWGTEGVSSLSPEQRALARGFIDAGAVAVWGHHPHVAGPVESYKGRPIFASTGNFLWDRMPTAQSGLLARVVIDGNDPRTATESWRVWPATPQARRVALPPTPKGETRVGAYMDRFDAEAARVSWILWTRTKAGRPVLRALEQTPGGFRVRATGFPREVARLEVGDINSDGRDELVVELRQRSKLDPRILPRLHVYGLGSQGFRPLWRGSQLSRPFFGWTLAPRADEPGSDLAALESGPNGAQWLCVYRWNGFGLRAVWQQPFAGQLRGLRSGVDERGVFLSFEEINPAGVLRLQARRASGENWRVSHVIPSVAHVIPSVARLFSSSTRAIL